jgi:hypothetical protein
VFDRWWSDSQSITPTLKKHQRQFGFVVLRCTGIFATNKNTQERFMGEIIRKEAAAGDIIADVQTSYTKAIAKKGKWE